MVPMFHMLQRSLIYFPAREPRIEPRDAGLPSGQVHTIVVRTEDQLDLFGWHVLADGHIAEDLATCDRELTSGRPLILYFSGNAANRRYRSSEFGVLTGLGVDVFIMDYRGYGDNSGLPGEAWFAADARAVWNYATRWRNVPPDRIVLYGESLGGAVAVRLAGELCDLQTPPAGLIIRSTFSSLVDTGAHHYPWLPIGLGLIDRYNSVDRIPQVQCPILQIHGAQDYIVPIALGRRLFDAAPQQSWNGIAKEFVQLPHAGHNDVMLVADEAFRTAVGQFLSRLDRPA